MDAGATPLIGVTTAFVSGRELSTLEPGMAVHVADTALSNALVRSGAVPVLLPVTDSLPLIQHYLNLIDGLVFSGGDGYPWQGQWPRLRLPDLPDLAPGRWRFEATLLQGALERDLPVLGICRGHQLIARVLSGPCLLQIDQEMSHAYEHHVNTAPLGRRSVHDVYLEPGTRLQTLMDNGVIGVNSLHRQAVARVEPPLIISARAPDGVVEGVESRAHRFVMGVQFHPELLLGAMPIWQRVFEAFVSACRDHRGWYGPSPGGRDWRLSRQSTDVPGA